MKPLLSEIGVLKFSKPENITELVALYDDITKRLSECANFRPGRDQSQDHAVEALECDLQDVQDELIRSSARMTLRSQQDLKDLLNFWHVVTVQTGTEDLSLSDRIIMNIRDFFDEAVLKT